MSLCRVSIFFVSLALVGCGALIGSDTASGTSGGTSGSTGGTSITLGSTPNGLTLTNNELTLQTASSTQAGALSATDYATFLTKESGLGNPSVSGQILSSTTAGARSWGFTENTYTPSRVLVILEDFMSGAICTGSNGWGPLSGGAGASCVANSAIDSSHWGIISLDTGTTATGWAVNRLGSDFILLGSGTVDIEMLVKVNTLSGTAGENFTASFGLGDSTSLTADTDGVNFVHNQSSANWLCVATSAAVPTTQNSGVSVSAGTWTRLNIRITNTSSADFSINGTSVCSVNSNVPTNNTSPLLKIVKTALTTSRTVSVDYYYLRYNLSAIR